MGQIISIPEAGIDYVLYGDKSNIVSNYIQQQLQSLPTVFNDFGQRVYNTLMTSYQFINDKLTQYGIKNKINKSGLKVIDDYIEELTSFNALQNANLVMQRWVMAHPEVRRDYLKQNIEGYSETYKNVFGNEVGEKDYNYRLVMDGVIQDQDDSWIVKHYNMDLMPGDRELDHYEKVKILSTWQAIDLIYSSCDFDFTATSEEPVRRIKP